MYRNKGYASPERRAEFEMAKDEVSESESIDEDGALEDFHTYLLRETQKNKIRKALGHPLIKL